MTYIRVLKGTTWWYLCAKDGHSFLYPVYDIAQQFPDIDQAKEVLQQLQQMEKFKHFKLQLFSENINV